MFYDIINIRQKTTNYLKGGIHVKENTKVLVWDKLAYKYDRLWVQKYSLTPTRKKVIHVLDPFINENKTHMLDLGCGTGQLLNELSSVYNNLTCYGFDKSEEMIKIAKSKSNRIQYHIIDISTEDYEDILPPKRLDLIICCHSFPYYTNKSQVLEKLHRSLKDDGLVIFVQASINSLYDKFVMTLIEKTAERAEYLSRKEFRRLTSSHFNIIEEFTIKEHILMPSICGFVMRKR